MKVDKLHKCMGFMTNACENTVRLQYGDTAQKYSTTSVYQPL